MDYEKKYNDALERAKVAYKDTDKHIKATIKRIFPELHESEDERIRKQLISICDEWLGGGYSARPCLNDVKWLKNLLEKQKEQKPILKFRIGDTIRKKAQPTWIKQITSIFEDKTYITGIGIDAYGIKVSEQDDWELVEQKPEIKYVYPKFRKGDVIEPITPNGSFTPVRVVGIWDGSYSCRSDDDKAYLSFPIKLEDEYRLVEPKPAEWSEEDEKKILFLERLIKYHVPEGRYGYIDKSVTKLQAITMLKSLRPSWKPSEEQMEALENSTALTEEQGAALYSLVQDLRKL